MERPINSIFESAAEADTGLSAVTSDRIEHEMASLRKEFKLIEESHGKNTLNLVIAVAYWKKITSNSLPS